jgi:hypothetical protein
MDANTQIMSIMEAVIEHLHVLFRTEIRDLKSEDYTTEEITYACKEYFGSYYESAISDIFSIDLKQPINDSPECFVCSSFHTNNSDMTINIDFKSKVMTEKCSQDHITIPLCLESEKRIDSISLKLKQACQLTRSLHKFEEEEEILTTRQQQSSMPTWLKLPAFKSKRIEISTTNIISEGPKIVTPEKTESSKFVSTKLHEGCSRMKKKHPKKKPRIQGEKVVIVIDEDEINK